MDSSPQKQYHTGEKEKGMGFGTNNLLKADFFLLRMTFYFVLFYIRYKMEASLEDARRFAEISFLKFKNSFFMQMLAF